MGEHATVFDFTTRRRIEATPEHPVVDGEVTTTTPDLPVSLRPTRATPSVRFIKCRAALAVAGDLYTEHAPRILKGDDGGLRLRIAYHVLKFLVVDFPFATIRGACLAVLAWWHWVHQTKLRRECMMDGRWSAKGDKIQAESTKRVKQTAIGALIALVAGMVVYHQLTPEQIKGLLLVMTVVLFCVGYQWRRPRRPVSAQVSTFVGGSLDGLRRALMDAGLMKEDQDVRPIEHPHPIGRGIGGVALLPSGLSVAKVIARKQEVASGLGCDSRFLLLAKEGSDDRLRFWIPKGDPFAGFTRRLPLLDVARWSAWKPAPFGFTAMDQDVDLRLMYSNMLIGSKPGAGKTFTARCVAAPYILDPTVPIYVANGKFDGAWAPLKDFATRYVRGRSDEQARAVLDMLRDVQAEMDRRFTDHMGDRSKVVESMGLPPMLVIVDELQNYTTNGAPTDELLRGKKATLGQWIDHYLVDIAKNGRAAGIILVLITQRPSDESLSTELRAQVGTRFALKTMDYHTSNMILGNVSKLGIDASIIDARHRGLGIFQPDMEEGTVDDDLGDYAKVRTYLCEDDDFAAMCAKGYALRASEGTLPKEVDVHEDSADKEPTPMPEPEALPIPDLLESILDFTADLDDRERVSSTELHERFVGEEMTTTAFGLQLRKWGCPSGRDGATGPRGPLVGEIRLAAQRIRDGGSAEVADLA